MNVYWSNLVLILKQCLTFECMLKKPCINLEAMLNLWMFVEATLFDYTLASSKPCIHTFTGAWTGLESVKPGLGRLGGRISWGSMWGTTGFLVGWFVGLVMDITPSGRIIGLESHIWRISSHIFFIWRWTRRSM